MMSTLSLPSQSSRRHEISKSLIVCGTIQPARGIQLRAKARCSQVSMERVEEKVAQVAPSSTVGGTVQTGSCASQRGGVC